MRPLWLAASLGLTCFACTGAISGQMPEGTGAAEPPSRDGETRPSPAPGDGRTPPPTSGGSTTAAPADTFTAAPAQLRKLTVAQYQNSIRDLLGASVRVPLDIEADTTVDGFATIGASEAGISQAGSEKLEAAARDVAHQVFTNDTGRRALLGCDPASAADPCVEAFLRTFGRRAWRRPLASAEVQAFFGLAKQASTTLADKWAGIELAVAGMLLSPKFVFRVELGAADSTRAGRRVYDAYEVASRMSFFLWDTTPDDVLLDAADNGDLSTAAAIERHADRLIASPRARAANQTFFTQYLQLEALDTLEKDKTKYTTFNTSLGPSMRREALAFVDRVMFEEGDVRELLSTRVTFVNRDLARVYGLPLPTGTDLVRTTWPDASRRAGLLGLSGFLAANAHSVLTSPTMRGRFIQEQLLCRTVPPPPPDVMSTFREDAAVTGPRTMRQRFEAHVVEPTCATCHRLTDPLGLPLENFDAIGAFRQLDAGLAIDTRGELDGAPVSDARSLALALRAHPDVAACLATKIYRHATGHVETAGEQPVLQAITRRFASDGHSFRSLLRAVVSSDGFRYAAEPR